MSEDVSGKASRQTGPKDVARLVFGLAAAAAIVVAPVPAGAEELALGAAGCDLAEGETGTVAAVIDAVSLQLEGGDVVRLAGISLEPPDGQIAADAIRLLEQLTLGKSIVLRYGELRRDRYQRATAHLFVAGASGEIWVQEELVEAGFAIVGGVAEDRTCLAALLGRQRLARSAGAGLWRDRAPVDAWSALLREGPARYELVEGLVISVGRTESTIYLNFGNDWSVDFTVSIAAADARRIEAEAGPLDILAGQPVRVRGWLEQWDGPWIRVDHPEQIEILGR